MSVSFKYMYIVYSLCVYFFGCRSTSSVDFIVWYNDEIYYLVVIEKNMIFLLPFCNRALSFTYFVKII